MGQKALPALPYMITHVWLVAGVLEIPRINNIIEAQKIFDIRLIGDAENPLARPMQQAVDAMAGVFLQDD